MRCPCVLWRLRSGDIAAFVTSLMVICCIFCVAVRCSVFGETDRVGIIMGAVTGSESD